MRWYRAVAFVGWLYALLLWAYICARIVVSEVPMSSPFIDGWFWDVNFWHLGIIAFVSSAACLVAYLIMGRTEWILKEG